MATFSGLPPEELRFSPVDDYLVHQTAATMNEMGYGDRSPGWNEHLWFGFTPRGGEAPFVVTRWMVYPNAGESGHLRAAAHVSHHGALHYFTGDRSLGGNRLDTDLDALSHRWIRPGEAHRVSLSPSRHLDVSFDFEFERRQDVQVGPCIEIVPNTRWTHTLQWLRVTKGVVRVGEEEYDAAGWDVWKDHCWGNSAHSGGVKGGEEPTYFYAWAALPLADRTIELVRRDDGDGRELDSWARTVWNDGRVEYADSVDLDMRLDRLTRRYLVANWSVRTGERTDDIELDPDLQGVALSDRDYGADLGPAWAEASPEDQAPSGRVWDIETALEELPVTGMHASVRYRVGDETGIGFMEWMGGKDHPRCAERADDSTNLGRTGGRGQEGVSWS